ncbi:DUF7563 family protein [Haladaptatus salinisoli]|uniref:DUF7563 family protein n=1 Tax=Haladaptatus salinisoli TaxID=2884876 RepID=UPI001D0B5BE0|nr:hypothetical protein [Haladaptatus salinisoli]
MSKASQFSTEATHRTHPSWGSDGDESSRFVTCRNEGCDNEHVDPKFARVLGDRDGRVFACPECTSWVALRKGAAANAESVRDVRRGALRDHR